MPGVAKAASGFALCLFEKGIAMQGELQHADLLQLVNSYQVSQAIHVAAVLGIADILKQGPRTADDIAVETEADPEVTYRLLRALAAVGVFREESERAFSLTPIGEGLLAGAPGSLRDSAIWVGQESNWNSWGNLILGVKSGENVFPQVYGTDVWEYRAKQPEVSAMFDRMQAVKGERTIFGLCDFSAFGVIVDVGGGNGTMLASILSAHPPARGILFDQPHVVSKDSLVAAGVADRCEVIGGDFFEAVPDGGDAYVLRTVIHDWDDDDAIAILKTCRKAMSGSAKLLLIERIVGPPNEDAHTKFLDLTMLVFPGGHERSPEEYSGLLEAADLRLSNVAGPGPDQFCVIEATAR
jgi:hypothetical protein